MAFTQWFQLSALVFVVGYTGPEIVSVKENNVELTLKSSVATLVAGSFYHDRTNERFYLAPTSGNPNTSGFTYVAYVWVGFCNVQTVENEIAFQIQGQDSNYYYEPFLQTSSLPVVQSSISELYRQVVIASLGAVLFSNTVWWYENRENYIWHNATCVIKKGKVADAYGSYITVFTGVAKNPEFTDRVASLQIEDIMYREFKAIPADRFSDSPDAYPDIDPAFVNAVIPVLLGKKTNITPPCTDTINFVYTVSQVAFGSDTFALNAISNVYKDGVALIITTDYTVNLAAGTFTLVADPGDSEITCDAEGLKISYDFVGASWNNTYTENIAEIAFFIFNKMSSISTSLIDLSAFNDLKSSRDVHAGIYFQSEIETIDLIKKLQPTGEFHVLTGLDGLITVTPYSRSTAPVEPDAHFRYSDLAGFSIREDTANVYSRVILEYDEDPTTGIYLYQKGERENVGHKFQTLKDITFQTSITNLEDASDLATTLIDFFDEPAIYVSGQITDGRGFDLKPLDKIFITRSVMDEKEVEYSIFDSQSFMIKGIGKSLSTNTVNFTAVKDLAQIAGLYIQDHNLDYVQDHNLNYMQT